MTTEAKLLLLAQQDPVLQGIFFTNGQMRWFDRQLQPNYLKLDFTCARIRRISTTRMYAHETKASRSQCSLGMVRFQIDVLDMNAERARAAKTAVIDWLATLDLSSDAQFASPPTSPTRHPTRVFDLPSGLEFQSQPPAYTESLDVRIIDLEAA